jgi:hypothetical protein
MARNRGSGSYNHNVEVHGSAVCATSADTRCVQKPRLWVRMSLSRGDKGGCEAKFLGGPETFGAENERKYSVSGVRAKKFV